MSHENNSENDAGEVLLPKGFNYNKEQIFQNELGKLEKQREDLLAKSQSGTSIRARDIARADLVRIENQIKALMNVHEQQRLLDYESQRDRVASALIGRQPRVKLSGPAAEAVAEEERRRIDEENGLREHAGFFPAYKDKKA